MSLNVTVATSSMFSRSPSGTHSGQASPPEIKVLGFGIAF